MVALLAQQLNIIEFPPSAIGQGKSNEWYTPARYIEAARSVMGGIDLDPASCELANRTVRAKRYYSKEDDGLTKPWHGRVWLNPPYGRGNQTQFISKITQEYQKGNVSQAIVLSEADTDASWFQPLWSHLICFCNHIVHFYRPAYERTKKHPTGVHMFGTCLAYLGSHELLFIEVFSQFGRIAKAIDTPRQRVTPQSLWEVSDE